MAATNADKHACSTCFDVIVRVRVHAVFLTPHSTIAGSLFRSRLHNMPPNVYVLVCVCVQLINTSYDHSRTEREQRLRVTPEHRPEPHRTNLVNTRKASAENGTNATAHLDVRDCAQNTNTTLPMRYA